MHDLASFLASGTTGSDALGVALITALGALATTALTLIFDRSHRTAPTTGRGQRAALARAGRRIAGLELERAAYREALIRHDVDPEQVLADYRRSQG